MLGKEQKINAFSTSVKYLIRLKGMHYYCFLFPIFVCAVMLPIFSYALNSSLEEIKFFTVNIVIMTSFIIPFAFLPIAIDGINCNHIMHTNKFKRHEYIRFATMMIFVFFIFYMIIILYILLLIIVTSIFIETKGVKLISLLFKKSDVQNSLFGNGINWINLFWTTIFSFFFCFNLGWIISTIFARKNFLYILIILYLVGILLSPYIMLSFKVISQVSMYKYFYFVSIFYYPSTMMLFAWSGIPILNFNPIVAFDSRYIYDQTDVLVISIIFYVIALLTIFIFSITNLIKTNVPFSFFSFFYSFSKRNKILEEIIKKDLNVGITTHSVRVSQIIAKRMYHITRNSTNTICMANNIDTFIPELSFLDNFTLFKNLFQFDYDAELLNSMIYQLNLQMIVVKKVSSLTPSELVLMNIIFSLMLKPKKIILVNPKKHIDDQVIKEALNLIKKYIMENDIKIVVISKNIYDIDILCELIVDVKNHKDIKTYSVQQWRDINKENAKHKRFNLHNHH